MTSMRNADFTCGRAQFVEAGDVRSRGIAVLSRRRLLASQLTGACQSIPDFLDTKHRIENVADADAYLARLEAFGLSQGRARLRPRAP